VPAKSREHVTTDKILALTGSTREMLYEWVAKRLLPRPGVTTGPGGEQFAVWPVEALERVRFIIAKVREGLAMDDVTALVEERWPRR